MQGIGWECLGQHVDGLAEEAVIERRHAPLERCQVTLRDGTSLIALYQCRITDRFARTPNNFKEIDDHLGGVLRHPHHGGDVKFLELKNIGQPTARPAAKKGDEESDETADCRLQRDKSETFGAI